MAATLFAVMGCATPRLPVPDRAAVERVEISWPQPHFGPAREVVVDDPNTVERFLAFLRAHDDGWEKPFLDSPAVGQISVSLRRGEERLFTFWIDPYSISCRDWRGTDADRVRSLSDRERAELLDILGVPKEPSAER